MTKYFQFFNIVNFDFLLFSWQSQSVPSFSAKSYAGKDKTKSAKITWNQLFFLQNKAIFMKYFSGESVNILFKIAHIVEIMYVILLPQIFWKNFCTLIWRKIFCVALNFLFSTLCCALSPKKNFVKSAMYLVISL